MRDYKLEWERGLLLLYEALAEVRNKISEECADENLDELAEYIGQYKYLVNHVAIRYLREHGYVKVTDADGKKKWIKKECSDGADDQTEKP